MRNKNFTSFLLIAYNIINEFILQFDLQELDYLNNVDNSNIKNLFSDTTNISISVYTRILCLFKISHKIVYYNYDAYIKSMHKVQNNN